jgi:outer membrane receptor protein involved in Fe transport
VFDNKNLPGIYHQQYGASLAYKFNDSWKVKVNTSIDKDLYFNRDNQSEENQQQGKTGNPANRSITDLSLQWYHKNYRLNFAFLNLFDEHYQDLANRPAQGRSFQLKFSIEDK